MILGSKETTQSMEIFLCEFAEYINTVNPYFATQVLCLLFWKQGKLELYTKHSVIM